MHFVWRRTRASLLTYHKFQDDLADEKGAKRALAALLCRLGRRGYEKARARMPEADEDIRQALEDLRRLEAERCRPWTVRRIRPRA